MLADEMPDLDNIHRKDTGCLHAPKCLSCPLPQCVHDSPRIIQKMRSAINDEERMAIIAAENLTLPQAADRFGITERTVLRIKARARQRKDASLEMGFK